MFYFTTLKEKQTHKQPSNQHQKPTITQTYQQTKNLKKAKNNPNKAKHNLKRNKKHLTKNKQITPTSYRGRGTKKNRKEDSYQ